MDPFIQHKGLVAPMDRANVDTDQIIPKQFLKRIQRTGYGQFLFNDWRFKEDGSLNPEFELNKSLTQFLGEAFFFSFNFNIHICRFSIYKMWFKYKLQS